MKGWGGSTAGEGTILECGRPGIEPQHHMKQVFILITKVKLYEDYVDFLWLD